MPTYLDPRHGASLSEAYAEAMAVAPIERAMLYTVELSNPGLTQPIRIVLNHEDIEAMLEDDAPYPSSDPVTFTALPLGIQLPEESDQAAAPSVRIWIDGVSATVAGELDNLIETLDPVLMIVRVYASDDLSGPANLPPLTMHLRDVELTETRVTGTASYADPANRAFPAKTFTRSEYSGLIR